MKDETPRPEPAARPQQRSFDQRKEAGAPVTAEATPGTRLYVGNLLYSAQATDVEQFFTDNAFQVAQINMSTDPFTGRNPSYCFVDLETADAATRAMSELNGKEVLGRPVKINPGVKKSFGSTPRREWGADSRNTCKSIFPHIIPVTTLTILIAGEYKPTFDRYARTDAREHWTGQVEQGKRLYVGGLPRIDGQATVDAEMQAVFEGFDIKAVSKIISPHPSKASEQGNHFYLFVDVASHEEAERAIAALDGKEMEWGGRLRVNRAKGDNKKVVREQKVTLDDFSKMRNHDKENTNGMSIQS